MLNEKAEKILDEIHEKLQTLASEYMFTIDGDKIVLSLPDDGFKQHYFKDIVIAPF